jgi:cytochrome c oxidase subunit 4
MADHAHTASDIAFAHPVPKKLLFAVFFILVGLTIFTVVANGWPLGKLDVWVALVIATIKASLVVLFFMHMWWEKTFNVMVFLTSFLFLTMFIGMTLMDTSAYRKSVEDFPESKRPTPPVVVEPVSETSPALECRPRVA